MTIRNVAFFSFFLCLIALSSCSPKQEIAAYYSYETECLGVEGDGSHTLKAWGKGSSKADALAQAKKNAVKDILFKGVSKGKSDCTVRPLIVEVNAEQKHQDYFFAFFADNGAYKKFISNADGSDSKNFVAGANNAYGVTVRVLRNKLRKQLVKDKILEQ